MASTRGRRACCRPRMTRCSYIVSWVKKQHQIRNSSRSVWTLLKPVSSPVSFPDVMQRKCMLWTQILCDTTLNISPRAARLQWLWGSLGELLILPCPVNKLLPTCHQLAMVRYGLSVFWVICRGCVQSFQTVTSVCGETGCTFISFSCPNGITDVMASTVCQVPLWQQDIEERDLLKFFRILWSVKFLPTPSFLGSLPLISSEWCLKMTLLLKIHLLLFVWYCFLYFSMCK